ncbi:hypothetical protein [Lelliottia wanjuensis]|uniref:hypothetical protein n=1 Tax=Lelliottia wanjuensis TaxID=3050585 RepID=UPI00254CA502|nr:hypothetical protein [Lelliottia sp. V86_10]MDK9585415.1 hypothetical protein [Lelliottia sp. V86_10]
MGLIGSMGAGKAAAAQAKAMKEIAKGYGKVGQKQYDWISPWMNAGTQALTAQIQMLANPMNSQAALTDYYAGPQYAQEQEQAQYAAEAGAEAAGGLGNTATSNILASESTQLGQQYLQGLGKARSQQFQQLGGISSQGLGATKTMGNWAYQDYNSAAGYLAQAAGLSGQATMAPYMAADQAATMAGGMGLYGLGGMMGGQGGKSGGDGSALKTAGKAAATALMFL